MLHSDSDLGVEEMREMGRDFEQSSGDVCKEYIVTEWRVSYES